MAHDCAWPKSAWFLGDTLGDFRKDFWWLYLQGGGFYGDIMSGGTSNNGERKAGVVICHKYPVVRAGLKEILGRVDGCAVVGEAGTLEEMMAALNCTVGVLILSINPEGSLGRDGLLLAELKGMCPSLRIIALTSSADYKAVRNLLYFGALAVVAESDEAGQIELAAERALLGKSFVGADLVRLANEVCALDRLTPAERQVLNLLAEGSTSGEVASALGKAVATVSKQKHSAMAKLGVNRSGELYLLLAEWRAKGWVGLQRIVQRDSSGG